MKRTLHMETLQNQIMAKLDLSREIEDGELVELIYQVLEEYAKDIYLPLRMKMEFGRDLFNAFRKLDILQELLEDESITEIMINGLENIFVEKKGEIYQYEKRFVSRKKLEDIAQQIASGCNRTVNEAEPIVDARLPDGSRVNLVLFTGGAQWTDHHDPKVSQRGDYDEAPDRLGQHLQRSGRVSGDACEGKVQYVYQRWDRVREDDISKCPLPVHTRG